MTNLWKTPGVRTAIVGAACTAPTVYAAPARNVILVYGALADGSGWKGVYDRLVAEGSKVSIVQEPETRLEDDVQATRRAITMQDGPVVFVGHGYGDPRVGHTFTTQTIDALGLPGMAYDAAADRMS